MNNNEFYHIKAEAFEELEEALQIKRVNDELGEHLLFFKLASLLLTKE